MLKKEAYDMRNALLAGGVYFAIVFVLGFVLGAVRVMAVAPAVGPTVAVLLELPFMLIFSVFACRACVRWFGVSDARGARGLMGATGFVLLMAVEATLAVLAAGIPLAVHLRGYLTASGIAGLTGQVAFALIPLFQRGAARPASRPAPGSIGG